MKKKHVSCRRPKQAQIPRVLCYLLLVFSGACHENLINPGVFGQRDLCYVKLSTNSWNVFTNNLAGSNPSNISNWAYTDEHANWSPDGRYVAFTREDPPGEHDLCLFDTEGDSLIAFNTSDSIDTDVRLWTPSGRLVYHALARGEQTGAYYMSSADGTSTRKISGFPEFFYPDSYTYLYKSGTLISRSNIDGTVDQSLLDLKTIGTNYVDWYDFNPRDNKILILADPTERLTNLLVTYQIDDNRLDTVSIAEPGWRYVRPKFSSAYDQIAVGEVLYANDSASVSRYRLSLIINRRKTILLEFAEKGLALDYRPFTFSRHDNYLAFTKSVDQSGTMAWRRTYIYALALRTGQIFFVDEGNTPQWNPATKY